MARSSSIDSTPFDSPVYEIRRTFLPLFSKTCNIYDLKRRRVFKAVRKTFQVGKDIYLYPVDDGIVGRTAVLILKARKLTKFSAVYDLTVGATNQCLGTFERQGLKSILNTEWQIIGPDGHVQALLKEESTQDILNKRLFGPVLPLRYRGEIEGTPVCTFDQGSSLIKFDITVRFLSAADAFPFDRRLGLAAGVLLCLVEGRPKPWWGNL